MLPNKKRRTPAHGEALPGFWPAKALPSFDSTLHTYYWPHGPNALLEERRTVHDILQAAHLLRMPVLEWPGVAASYSCAGVGFLGMHLSVDEAFIEADTKRNMLVDRAHQNFNTTWKLEVQALTCDLHDGLSSTERAALRFQHYELTEEYLYATVDKIDAMRVLFDSLKPETVALIGRCRTTNELRRSMVVTVSPCLFLNP
jgi:hypothetical protein